MSALDIRALDPPISGSRWISRITVAACILAVHAGSAVAQDRGAIERAAAEAIRRLDLQIELPFVPEPPPWQVHLPPMLVQIGLVIAVLIVCWLGRDRGRRMWAQWRRRENASWTSATDDPAGSPPRADVIVVTAADDLARKCRFADAMHALLLQSLTDIHESLGERFAVSLTSREILRLAPLDNQGRRSLRDIIARVEWTYFGEHPADRADYEGCRESFQDLAQVLRGGASA